MLRTRPNATPNAARRRSSLEVSNGAEQYDDDDIYNNTKRELRFPGRMPRRRRRKPSTSRLLVTWQRGIRRRMRHYWNRNLQKALPFAIVCTGVAILVIIALVELLQFAMSPSKSTTSTISTNFEILFPAEHQWRMHKNKIRWPLPMRDEDMEERLYDFGGLEMDFFVEDNAVRNIVDEYGLRVFADYVNPLKPTEDEEEDLAYFAFDDDFKRDEYGKDTDHKYQCRRTHQHRLNFPTCNTYHEIDFIESQGTYLNAGAYRQVMVGRHEHLDTIEPVIFKDIHFDFDATEENYEFVRMDAIVAERLTASPRIYDIYGLCGLGILSEYFPLGDLEKEIVPEEEVSVDEGYDPRNDLTPLQKLIVAKQMAESVADLHGHEGGVIVHQDIQLSQFLWNADRTMIKLNDFNRAEFMLFDDHKNEYCGYWEGPGSGTWRSAEEYEDKALSEKVDVFSLGNNFFAILTGVDPFNDQEHTSKIQKLVKHGVKAPIAEAFRKHSFSEHRLAHLVDYCHEWKPKDRPTIFEIVEYLEVSIRDAISKGEE